MRKPKSISARTLVDGLPYIGEYHQPDGRVYRKDDMDKYIKYLEDKRNLTSRRSRAADGCAYCDAPT